MKQAIIKKGGVELEEVPAPKCQPGHVLVQTQYSLISVGTEMTGVIASGQSLLQRVKKQPQNVAKVVQMVATQGISKTYRTVKTILDMGAATGYSLSGIVLEVGADIQDFKVGDQVACAGAGLANHAEVVCIPRNLVIKVPQGVSLADASSVTLGSIALQGVRQADPKLGDNVAVLGLGLLGQLTVQFLKANGCRVLGVDLDQKRLDTAKKFGLDLAVKIGSTNPVEEALKMTANHGVDVTIITAATESHEPLQQAMEMTRKKGTVVIVGAIGTHLQRAPFYQKEIDLKISCSYGPGRYDPNYEEKGHDYPYGYVRWTENRNMQAYLDLIKTGKMDFATLAEKEYPFAEVSTAYESLKSATKPLAVRLKYPAPKTKKPLFETRCQIESPSQSSRKIKDKINVALVGAGNFAVGMHLPHLQKLKKLYHLKAIVERDSLKAKQIAREFDAEYCTTSYQDVLKDDSIDLIIICTRHNQHAEQVMQAAEAGKAILVEKPLCLNQKELGKITQTLKKHKTPCMVAFNRRFSPHAKKIKALFKDRQNPMVINYRLNGGFIPSDHWVQNEVGGGRIIGEACHMFDLFNYLTGSKAKNVIATSITPPAQSKFLAGDNVSTTITFEDGSIANLIYTASGSTKLPKERVEVFCEGKSCVIDDYQNLETYGCKGSFKSKTTDKGHFQELIEFAETLKAKKTPPISWEECASATEISFEVNQQAS